jgi:ProP effector
MTIKFDRAEITAVITLLAEWFPKTFFIYERRRKPLKLRIDLDLQTVLNGAIMPNELHRALRFYCGNEGYLRSTLKGAWRVDLAGNPVGAVTLDEENNAKQKLAAMEAKRARRKQAIAQQKAGPKRLSLADLKTAARARVSAP